MARYIFFFSSIASFRTTHFTHKGTALGGIAHFDSPCTKARMGLMSFFDYLSFLLEKLGVEAAVAVCHS